MHEDFRRQHEIKPGSDRSFGLVIGAAFVVVGLAPLRHGLPPRWWAFALALAFAGAAVWRPGVLRHLNAAWMKLGLLLNRVTSPVLLAIVFYGGVMPTGLLMRAFGRDPMRRRRDPQSASYWIARPPEQSSMKQQF